MSKFILSYASEHNVNVKNYLMSHLNEKFKEQHSPKKLTSVLCMLCSGVYKS